MRALALLSIICTLYSKASSAVEVEPAVQPFENVSPRDPNPLFLLKRQNACSSGLVQCTAVNSAVCCPTTAVCTRDQSGNAACCPTGVVCTGALGGSTIQGSSSTTPYVLGGSTTQPSSSTDATAQVTVPAGYSTVANQYYPFIAIPTSYSNSQACLSAYTLCSSASQACLSSLAGTIGVTVSGLGSQGLTQSGSSGTVISSAAAICSSLSSRGCYDLQSGQCNSFGSAGTTATQGLVQAGVAVAAARCTGAVYTAAAAVVAGLGVARMAVV